MGTSDYGWGLPADISTHGFEIDRLIGILHAVMIVLFVGWFVFMVYTLVRFRARTGHRAAYATRHFRAPTWLEGIIAVFELFLLAAFSAPLWAHVRNEIPPAERSLQVRVVAQQFAWNIHYPGKDGLFGKTDPKLMDSSNPVGLDRSDPAAKDDVTTINQFHAPVHTPVVVQLSSKDVIHSFAVPVLRVKQDAIPGEKVRLWFEATRTGQFEIACAQLCGLGHYRMKGFFVAEELAAFAEWLSQQAPKGAAS